MNRFLAILFVAILFFSCVKEKEIDRSIEAVNIDQKNGVLHYQAVPFTGVLVGKHSNSELKTKTEYTDGLKHGKSYTWYADGQLQTKRVFNKGVKTGMHQGWWERGERKFTYYFNDSGQYEGSVKEWYKSGDVYRDLNYKNGKENGSQQVWKSDGRIRANYVVVDGERYGLIGLKRCYTVMNKDGTFEK